VVLAKIWSAVWVGRLLLRTASNIGFESFAIATRTHTCHYNGADEQTDRQYGECCQLFPCSYVCLLFPGLVHANELEAEISKAAKVKGNDNNSADQVFAPGEPESCEHDDDGCRNGCGCGISLNVVLATDYDDKLDGETKAEKEVEFQEGDVDLVGKVAALHTQVGGNVFVDGPGKFVVELVSAECHNNGEKGQDTRDGNQ